MVSPIVKNKMLATASVSLTGVASVANKKVAKEVLNRAANALPTEVANGATRTDARGLRVGQRSVLRMVAANAARQTAVEKDLKTMANALYMGGANAAKLMDALDLPN